MSNDTELEPWEEALARWNKSFDGLRTRALMEAGAKPEEIIRLAFSAGYQAGSPGY